LSCSRKRKRFAWSWATGAALLTAIELEPMSRASNVIARGEREKLVSALDMFAELNN
jgi:hypothetical protein